jgi:transcriptional regulator with XRE-family HTH domain
VNSKLFNEVRLAKGLSGFQIGIETELSAQSVQRILKGKGSFPSTVKKVGEYLGIPAKQWYIHGK